jgi:hypothetical protein
MTRALAVCGVLLVAAIEARANGEGAGCQRVRGKIAETRLLYANFGIPSSDASRLLGTVTGTLRGASTVHLTSTAPPVTSYDVFLTKSGDLLIAIGAPTRTPIPGQPGEFNTHVDLTVIGGAGKNAEATGTMTFDGVSHTGTVPPTVDLAYTGTVCGPNVKGQGEDDDN